MKGVVANGLARHVKQDGQCVDVLCRMCEGGRETGGMEVEGW